MSRKDLNEQFLQTSFLHGSNTGYIEDLQRRFDADPGSVGEEWRSFFKELSGQPNGGAYQASWARSDWPIAANGELVSALDSDWSGVEQHIGDKLRQKAHLAGA